MTPLLCVLNSGNSSGRGSGRVEEGERDKFLCLSCGSVILYYPILCTKPVLNVFPETFESSDRVGRPSPRRPPL